MQELGMRARVLLFGSKLNNEVWGEAMHHANSLRNRLPSERLAGNLPILAWDSRTRLSYDIPAFGDTGFAYLYQPDTRANKKLSQRSAHGHFVGMGSDETLNRIYVPSTRRIIITRAQDFHSCNTTTLPGVATLLDGIARQNELLQNHTLDDTLVQAFLTHRSSLLSTDAPTTHATKYWQDHLLPRSFAEACQDPKWCDAIDREYQALCKRNVWDYVPASTATKIIPFTWVFRLKPIDTSGAVLHKARCCARGYIFKSAYLDFDPNALYTPVASHDAVCAVLAFCCRCGIMFRHGLSPPLRFVVGW